MMVRPARGCGEQINPLSSPCPWPAGACRHRVAYCCEPDTGGGAGGGGAGGAADGCCDGYNDGESVGASVGASDGAPVG